MADNTGQYARMTTFTTDINIQYEEIEAEFKEIAKIFPKERYIVSLTGVNFSKGTKYPTKNLAFVMSQFFSLHYLWRICSVFQI